MVMGSPALDGWNKLLALVLPLKVAPQPTLHMLPNPFIDVARDATRAAASDPLITDAMVGGSVVVQTGVRAEAA